MKYVLSSWKMYLTADEEQALFKDAQTRLLERAEAGNDLPRVILCPSYLSLLPLKGLADDRVVALGAQNCHWEPEGAHTGEISPKMLQGLVEYVLVGHSERRAAGETDEQIAKKVAAVTQHGMIPILLVGEDDKGGDAIQLTEERLRQGLSGIDLSKDHALVVYEPTWAIGVEERASADHIRRSVEHLKQVLTDLGTSQPEILYGGTVNEENVDELTEIDVLAGVGTGRASLDADRFLAIIDRVAGRHA